MSSMDLKPTSILPRPTLEQKAEEKARGLFETKYAGVNPETTEIMRRALEGERNSIEVHEQQRIQTEFQEQATARAEVIASSYKLPIESMLALGLLGTLCYVERPITFLVAFAGGNLICAWSPVTDIATERTGEIASSFVQVAAEDHCADKLLLYVVGAYPVTWLLSWIPGVSSLCSLLGTGYSLTLGGLAGSYMWRQQRSAWRERRQPTEQQPEGTQPSLFRIREATQWMDERIRGLEPANSPLRRLDDFWRHWQLPGNTAKLMTTAGTVGLVTLLYQSPHAFTLSLVVSAYLAASSDVVEGVWSDNPLVRRLDHLGAPGMLMSVTGGCLYLVGTFAAWGFAMGLATSAYQRGPFSFPIYQVISLAYTNSIWETAFSVAVGAVVGQQLWSEARMLHGEQLAHKRPDFMAALTQGAAWIGDKVGETVQFLKWANSANRDQIRQAIRTWALGEVAGGVGQPGERE